MFWYTCLRHTFENGLNRFLVVYVFLSTAMGRLDGSSRLATWLRRS